MMWINYCSIVVEFLALVGQGLEAGYDLQFKLDLNFPTVLHR